MSYILISDIFFRKPFDIISILKRKFPSETLLLGISSIGISHKIKSYLIYGNERTVFLRSHNRDLFWKDLMKISGTYSDDSIVYLPVEEDTTEYFISYIEKYGSKNFKFLLPDSTFYGIFRNKAYLNSYCLENGFPAPRKFSLPHLFSKDFPLLLKPCVGSGSKGIVRLFSLNDYTDKIKGMIQGKEYLAQEMIPNGKNVHGAFFLCKRGKVISAYTHQRIRTVPEEGGVTVFSRMDKDDRLIRQGSLLLKKVGWDGVVMLEYLYDKRDDTYKLIEANPRLWGSIMLSEYGGAFLLENYIHLCLNQPCKAMHINPQCFIQWFFMDFIGCIKKYKRIIGFIKFQNICFINWTYARKDRAIIFFFLSIFKLSNIKKFVKRL